MTNSNEKPIAVVPRSVAEGTDAESRSVMRTVEESVLAGTRVGLVLEDEDWRRPVGGIASVRVTWCSYPDLAALGPHVSAEILRRRTEEDEQ